MYICIPIHSVVATESFMVCTPVSTVPTRCDGEGYTAGENCGLPWNFTYYAMLHCSKNSPIMLKLMLNIYLLCSIMLNVHALVHMLCY